MQQEHNTSAGGFLPVQIGNEPPEIILSEIDGEPRARDLDIAQRLGFGRDRKIRELIERNLAELETFGPLALRRGKSRGQEFIEYWLTEEQALLIASRSDAEKAAEVRRVLIKVFVAWRRGHLVPAQALSPAEMFLQNAQAMVAIERQQVEQGQKIKAITADVQLIKDTAPLKAKPQNAESLSEVRKRINRKYGLPARIIDTVLNGFAYSPRPAGRVKNSHEDAQGSSYAVYWIRDVTQVFKLFVAECKHITATQATHRLIEGRFKLTKPAA